MKVHILLFLVAGLCFTSPAWGQFDEDDSSIQDEFEDESDDSQAELNVPKEERPVYKAPVAQGNTYFTDAFESEASYVATWTESRARKDGAEDDVAKYDGQWSIEELEDNPLQGDLYLVLKSKAKHHATAAKLKKPYEFTGEPFVAQYEVRFQTGQDCGGAYIKLLTHDTAFNPKKFVDKTPYTIMFGPDKCGTDSKLHFIFRHKNPITGEFEEKHAKKPSSAIESFFTDKKTHLYTLVVNPDNSFEIYVDQNLVNSGSLLEDVSIPDPDATKPDDWDESEPEKIEDEDAVMPDGWLEDEPELIPDEDAERPDDWDDDIDGEWEPPMINNPACEAAPGCGEWSAPMIKNPKYKGKWRPPMIDNPNYKGKWKARMIENPDYFEDTQPYKMSTIGAVGLELWSMSNDIAFDNFIITDSKEVADQYAADSWELKHTQELAGAAGGRSVVDAVLEATNERPWLWAVFVVVIVLPIVLVIAYCCMPGSSKEGVFHYLWSSAMERKWLFAVYVVVVLLPFAILSVWLCPNSGPGIKQDDLAKRKKTDAPSPDVKDDEEDEDEEDEEDEEKSDDKVGDSGDGEPKEGTSSGGKKKAGKGQLEADKTDEADAEDEEEAPQPTTRTSPRKKRGKASRTD